MTPEKPPVFLPEWIVVDWFDGAIPEPPDGMVWQRDLNRRGLVAVPWPWPPTLP